MAVSNTFKDDSVTTRSQSPGHDIRILISPKRVCWFFTGVAACFFFIHIVTMYLVYQRGDESVFTLALARMFDLLRDTNIPTWYSSLIMSISAALLAVIAYAKRAVRGRFARHWFGLSVIFVLLSIDETAMIHEGVQRMLRMWISSGSTLYSLAAVAATGLFALIVFVVYLRFLAGIPRRTMVLFLIAGGVFVSGALGLDYIGELYKNAHGEDNFTFAIMNGVEDVLEMGGIIIFIYALLDYLRNITKDF
jgi:hypothetical protein